MSDGTVVTQGERELPSPSRKTRDGEASTTPLVRNSWRGRPCFGRAVVRLSIVYLVLWVKNSASARQRIYPKQFHGVAAKYGFLIRIA
jgi:hypothetical protein